MTDYRFVSAPEVVLRHYEDLQGAQYWTSAEELHLAEFSPDQCEFLIDRGIIEPVPVEIPEYVVEAAVTAYFGAGRSAPEWVVEGIRAALIAAKRAEEAGE